MKHVFFHIILLISVGFSCTSDKTVTGCELYTARTYAADIKPIMTEYCIGCHGSTSPKLESLAEVSASYDKVLCTITDNGCKLMPLGGAKLNDTIISKLRDWKCNNFK